jgi:transformation/transcription domain-associated protein
MKIRANVAVELRDNIEPLCSGASYPIFLSKIWPVFKSILTGEPVFTNLSLEQVSCGNFVFSCLLVLLG